MTNLWQLVVATTAGELLGSLDAATSRTITWVLGDVHTASFNLDGFDPTAQLIYELETDLLVYCNSTLWFRGRLGASGDQIDSSGHTCSFSAVSYRGMLARRILWPGNTDSFTSEEQTAICWQLISDSQGLPGGNLGIVDTADATGITRDADFTTSNGSLLSDLIDGIATLDQGFDWDIGVDLTFDTWYPQRGVATGALVYPGNLTSAQRTVDTSTFASAVYVTDSNTADDGEGGTATLTPATATAATFGPAGRLELATSSTTITDQATLDAYATTVLADSEEVSPSWQLVLAEGWWDPTQIWLGDQPQLAVTSGRLAVNTVERVSQIEVDLGDDGGETVTVTCGDVVPDQTRILRDYARRLARLETS